MSEAFGDIPLFREIQRLLASSKGPVNYEIARQVAGAVGGGGGSERVPPEWPAAFSEAVRDAEFLVAGYTGLSGPEPARAAVVDRRQWVGLTLEGWGWLLEDLAARFTGEPVPEEGAETAPLQVAMSQMAPLLLGIQAGILVGNLAGRAIARYDIALPRSDAGELFIVGPNAKTVVDEYGLDHGFLKWLALREAIPHAVATSVRWLVPFWKNLASEVVAAIEIDSGELERRLMDLQAHGLGAGEELSDVGGQLPIVPTERHRRALARLQSFEALLEGYRANALDTVAGQTVPDAARYAEGLTRFRAEAGEAEELLGSVLGLKPGRALHSSGATFCAAVVKLKGLPTLNRVWEAPDNLPTLEEIKDPFAWMERVEPPE